MRNYQQNCLLRLQFLFYRAVRLSGARLGVDESCRSWRIVLSWVTHLMFVKRVYQAPYLASFGLFRPITVVSTGQGTACYAKRAVPLNHYFLINIEKKNFRDDARGE